MNKKIISLLLCLLLVLPSVGFCSATYQITESQLNSLQANSIALDRIIEILGQNSNLSAKQLIEVEAKLAKVEQRLLLSENALKQTDNLLQKQDESITKANQFLTQYSKEQKQIQNRLKVERTFLMIIAGLAIGYAATK